MAIKLGGKPVTKRDLTIESPRLFKFIGTVEAVDGAGEDDLYAWWEGSTLTMHRRFFDSARDGWSMNVPPGAITVTNMAGYSITLANIAEDPYYGELWCFLQASPDYDQQLRKARLKL